MRRAWQAWLAWLERREEGTTLAVFRIAVAAILLTTLASVWMAGLVEVVWVDAAFGGYRSLGASHWLLSLLGGARPSVIWSLFAVATVGGVSVLVGFGGRIAAALTLLAYYPMATVNADASGGSDLMLTNALWLLVLGDGTATLSVDCWRRHRRWTSDALVAAWPRGLVIVQLLTIYGATGLHKLSIDWVPGGTHAALWWVFHDPTWCRFDLRGGLVSFYLPMQIAAAVTWWWEVTAPLLLVGLWLRATVDRGGRLRRFVKRIDPRWVFTGIGIAIHGGIFLLLEVGPFSFISLAYYFGLWAPAELRSVGAAVARRAARTFEP